MDRYGVVTVAADHVGLVRRDIGLNVSAQAGKRCLAELDCLVVKHAGVPRPRNAEKDRREGVDRRDPRRSALLRPVVEMGGHAVMKRREHDFGTPASFLRIEADIAGDVRVLRLHRNAAAGTKRPSSVRLWMMVWITSTPLARAAANRRSWLGIVCDAVCR